MNAGLQKYIEKKERIVQTFLIIAGLLIAHTQNISLIITLISNLNQSTMIQSSEIPTKIISFVSASSSQFLGFLIFIVLYYVFLQNLNDFDLEYDSFKTYTINMCAFAASAFFSIIILLYMDIQDMVRGRAIRNDYLFSVIFTLVIFSQLIVLPKHSILLKNKEEPQTRIDKLKIRVIRAFVLMFMFLAFMIYKYQIDKLL